jgi:hypothetical protein
VHDDGHSRAPKRYSAQGRETLDRIRDRLHAFVEAHPEWVRDNPADAMMLGFALGNDTKYGDRLGLKEGVPSTRDEKAKAFYRRLAEHLRWPGVYDDPRSLRPDFEPYTRQPWEG